MKPEKNNIEIQRSDEKDFALIYGCIIQQIKYNHTAEAGKKAIIHYGDLGDEKKREKIIATFVLIKKDGEKEKAFHFLLEKTKKELKEYQDAEKYLNLYLKVLCDAYDIQRLAKIEKKPAYFPLEIQAFEKRGTNDIRPCTYPGYYSYCHER